MLETARFPRSARYPEEWVLSNEMGPNVLWLTEWLAEVMQLAPGMRVLDMGCGRALSSIFLAREYGVQVWANDLWIEASQNLRRIEEASLADRVFPIHAEAHALPYAEAFFDAVVSLDSYHYYGTDELYLAYFVRFLKRGGRLGIVCPGLVHDFDEVPEHLSRPQSHGRPFWDPSECGSFKTAEWWRKLWARTGLVEMERAEHLPEGCRLWLQFEKARIAAGATRDRFPSDVEALRADDGEFLTFVRVVGRRR